MKKSKSIDMNITNELFNKIKSNKINYYIISNSDDYKEISSYDKVVLISEKDKKLKKKIKKVSIYKDFNDVYDDIPLNKLGFKKDDKNVFEDTYKKDMDDNGLLIVEFRKKKRIMFKLFFSIIFIIMIIMLAYSIKIIIDENNAKKFNDNYEKIISEKTNYVFIDINPSFVLKTKNDIVVDVACLNEDCISIYDKIDILNKNVNNSIENLYQVSRDNGFKTDGKISIKSTSEINVSSNKIDVDISYISESDKDKLLSDVKNNKDIISESNEKYYNHLLVELKKDKDYDKIYTCSFINEELECHFIMDAITPPLLNTKADILGDLTEYTFKRDKIIKIFNKFGIKNISSGTFGFSVYINNVGYSFTPQLEISNGMTNEHFTLRMIIYKEIKNTTYENVDGFQIPHYEHGYDYINIEDIDLLNPSRSLNKMVKYRMS